MPRGPAITIIRDPLATFESGYSYFGKKPKVCGQIALLYVCNKGDTNKGLTINWCQLIFELTTTS